MRAPAIFCAASTHFSPSTTMIGCLVASTAGRLYNGRGSANDFHHQRVEPSLILHHACGITSFCGLPSSNQSKRDTQPTGLPIALKYHQRVVLRLPRNVINGSGGSSRSQ